MERTSLVVLVTGGSAGIGKAVASHLSELGHIVFGTSRSQQDPAAFPFEILQMDVTDEQSVQTTIESIIQKHGRLDVLINNAGLGMAGPLENTSDEEAKNIFDTNVFGVLNTCRHAVPHLRKSEGYMINITSIAGVFGLPFRGIYSSSKSAVETISECYSLELKPHNVKVAVIEPGDFKTKINENRITSAQVNVEAYPRFKTVLQQIHDEVDSALDPILIGKCVERILNDSSPKLRYQVATPIQKMSVLLYRFLPGRFFEKLLAKHYGLRRTKS